MPPKKKQEFTVRQVRSQIGSTKDQRATLLGLGLGRIGKTRTLEDTPATRGMAKKVAHLIAVS